MNNFDKQKYYQQWFDLYYGLYQDYLQLQQFPQLDQDWINHKLDDLKAKYEYYEKRLENK